MNPQYQTKAQVKAAQNASQDKPSQDGLSEPIPTIEGLQASQEALYAGHRLNARLITQGIKCQAYIDEFQAAIEDLSKGEVQPDFLHTLRKSYSPVFSAAPMPLLIQSGVNELPSENAVDSNLLELGE